MRIRVLISIKTFFYKFGIKGNYILRWIPLQLPKQEKTDNSIYFNKNKQSIGYAKTIDFWLAVIMVLWYFSNIHTKRGWCQRKKYCWSNFDISLGINYIRRTNIFKKSESYCICQLDIWWFSNEHDTKDKYILLRISLWLPEKPKTVSPMYIIKN